MQRLLEHFSVVISDALEIKALLSTSGDRLDSGLALRNRLLDGVQKAQADARKEVRPEQDLQLASHGVVAWIDEVMLAFPGWGTEVANLQGELLGTQIARETFFNYLEQLGDEQDEVREIYYMLLCLGFKGYYGELSSGAEELERLKELHGRRLAMVPASSAALLDERLNAQPYGLGPPPKPKGPKRRRWGMILSLILIPLVLLVAAAWFFMLPWWLRQQVDAKVAGLECSAVDVSLGNDRVASLSGYVATDDQREALSANLEQIFGLAGVQGNVAVFPWPFCEVLEIVRPFFDQNFAKQFGLALGITAANGVLKRGDPLVLTITAPNYPAYLYVDYYQQNGDVGHIAHADASGNPDIAGDKFEFPTGYQGSPPYGKELLTIFALPEPLFERPMPAFENARTYLPLLRSRLKELSNNPRHRDLIASSLVFIRTEP